MSTKHSSLLLVSCLGMIAVAPGHSWAADLKTLFSFNRTTGGTPHTGLIADAQGNLFGTTSGGGPNDAGTVFEIAKTAGGYAATPTTLVIFDGADGANPSSLTIDASGNLFGTNINGRGPFLFGTVFEIAKAAGGGYASVPATLARFTSFEEGEQPANLIADIQGNLIGTAQGGGPHGDGTVFEIAKTPGGYASTPTTLVSFDGKNGYGPAVLIADRQGNLIGADSGGAHYNGTVFEIAKTAGGYASTVTVLADFNVANGANLDALIVDTQGNLFGTAYSGGAYLYGTVFEIARTANGYASSPTTLVSFDGKNAYFPTGLIADANGDLFGTTYFGGTSNAGTVFEIAKTASGYASAPTILVSFGPNDGAAPLGLIADRQGNLIGTTEGGLTPANSFGGVFEVTGSGFVVPSVFAGTPGARDCFWTSASALIQQYHGVAAAAAALGYPGAWALRKALVGYCYCHQPHPR